MPINAASRFALAGASAYLRVNHVTRHADVVHGAQVNYVLTQVHDDQQVKPQPGGGFVVTTDDWAVIQYAPLHSSQDMLRSLADSYQHWSLPRGGDRPVVQPEMSGKSLRHLMARAPGRFWRTQLDEIAHLHGGRLVNQFKPVAAAAQVA